MQHAGNGIDAQTVEVKLMQPIQRVGNEEVLDLCPPKVEDIRTPIGVLPPLWIGVLEQRSAVKACESPFVLWKVSRHPISNHANAVLVQYIDHRAQVVGGSVPRGWRVVARHLVAPRLPIRILGDRQQLNVGEAKCDHVIGELTAKLAIIRDVGPPRPQVHFVYAQRSARAIAAR